MKLKTKNDLSFYIFELLLKNKELLNILKDLQKQNEKNILIMKDQLKTNNYLRNKLNLKNKDFDI
jgi:flagellar biosynthesis/type III secretory pathway chaperone